MPVPAGLTGRYIQRTHRLRFGKDAGDSFGHTVSERPFQTVRGKRVFQDGGPEGDKSVSDKPTYVTIEADDNINVQFHIDQGGLIPAPVATRATKKATGK